MVYTETFNDHYTKQHKSLISYLMKVESLVAHLGNSTTLIRLVAQATGLDFIYSGIGLRYVSICEQKICKTFCSHNLTSPLSVVGCHIHFLHPKLLTSCSINCK